MSEILTPEDIANRLRTSFSQPGCMQHTVMDEKHEFWVFQLARFQYWIYYHRNDDGPPVISATLASDRGGNDMRDGYATIETLCDILAQIISCESLPLPEQQVQLTLLAPYFGDSNVY